MIFFDNLKDFIRNLNHKEIVKYSFFYVSICATCIVAIFIRHIIISNDLDTKLTQLNKARKNVQQIFTQFQIVQNQKTKIEDLLKKNKNFYIQKYIQDLINQQRLNTQASLKFGSDKLPNGYTQENITLSLNGLNTKQLCDFLLAVQQQPLVYVLSVDIAHVPQAKKINVSMIVATLRSEE
ncbi:hypothetical protein KAZ82_01940 [Candidatus Babeliales bacterium]|nr:hypothetical protein [Candidatus Babeliales bacterium]